ncbi:M28 family peptidase [Acidipila sp. EB88]|uniref:M28 family peptidase n=1 Tax=Acidipila sp. EB88 TaxID=2305226 RepID=UPI000F600D7B|nr:M28 family peptidase [Acidipila sp. EB88]RRA48359.1 peptidase M28 [Acidipila sp. EB88]
MWHIRTPLLLVSMGLACGASLLAQTGARDAQIRRQAHDADTLAWWHRTEQLANDTMAGREPGTAAYDRAALLVANEFKAAGLEPAGEAGTFFQPVPLLKLDLDPAGTEFHVERPGTASLPLRSLEQIAVRLGPQTPASFRAPLVWAGYCEAAQLADASAAGLLAGAIAVCFRPHLGHADPGSNAALLKAHVAAVMWVDDPSEPLEPPRWPLPAARVVTLAQDTSAAGTGPALLTLRLNWEALPSVLQGSQHTAQELLAAARTHAPSPSFAMNTTLAAHLHITTQRFTASNVLAVLPGTSKTGEYLAVSAHLDGYGRGEPIGGDAIYNGALDDAAYVALLEQLAARQHAQGFARSVLFCAFTAEEEGLLGSEWFTQHPTVPGIVADINLDQLRPLFPLRILTTLAVDDSTLGGVVRAVAAARHVEVRADREPERGLLHRSDHWPFMQTGVPAVGFIFGYDPGTEAESRYRTWYRVQYHRPQDDLAQPIDFRAARDFNAFFYALVAKVADDPARPTWLPAGANDHPATPGAF